MDNNAAPQSVISNEVEITGAIKSSGSVRLDGKLDGELQCSGDAIIGKSATIKGNLTVNSVSIEGTIQGNVVAKDRIEMKSTARVTGDIKAKRLSVEDGVTFVGKSEVNPAGSPLSAAAPAVEPAGTDAPSEATAARVFARR
jgi:cytoskeletal protein CcmA (bactofilin family)